MAKESWVQMFVERVTANRKTKCMILVAYFLDSATPDEIASLKRAVQEMLDARKTKKG